MSSFAATGKSAAPAVKLSGSTALAGHIIAQDVAVRDLGKCLLPLMFPRFSWSQSEALV